uniref:Uncharacterized protein n=1 Tax=Oncorhynchus mykiss TaxID=8022 RepID=A0A8C7TWJ5_ONCMY
MTMPSVTRDLLMLAPSFSLAPVAHVASALSLPAKSTRWILLTISHGSSASKRAWRGVHTLRAVIHGNEGRERRIKANHPFNRGELTINTVLLNIYSWMWLKANMFNTNIGQIYLINGLTGS